MEIGETLSNMIDRICTFWFLLFVLIVSEVAALKLINLTVPHYKFKGEMAFLECNYDLEGDRLYALKWYKDNEEFYRYVPQLQSPQTSYKVDGIRVDHQMSDSRQVALRAVNHKSSGLYRCEVSAEAPSFASAHNESRMEVVTLPNTGPHITGSEKEYQVGDEIRLNCTSGRSYPVSTLHWYVNEKPVDSKHLEIYQSIIHPHGLLTSILGLRMHVTSNHFTEGQMKIKCVASISPVLWQGDKESIVQRVQTPIDNREALLLVRGGSAKVVGFSAITLLLSIIVHFISS